MSHKILLLLIFLIETYNQIVIGSDVGYENVDNITQVAKRQHNNITLSCINSIEDTITGWYKDSVLQSTKSFTYVNTPNVNYEDKNGVFHMNIMNISDQDEGIYTCKHMKKCGRVFCEITTIKQYEVILYEDITMEIVQTPHIVMPDDSVNITCNIKTGSPYPVIEWKRKDITAPEKIEGNTLFIENVASSDEGIYTCIADNGERKQLDYKFKMNFNSHLVDSSAAQISAKKGAKVILQCTFRLGIEQTNVTWMHNGISTIDTIEGKIGSRVKSQFIISNIRSDQFGNYSCSTMEAGDFLEHQTMIITDKAVFDKFTSTSTSKFSNLYKLKFEAHSAEKMLDYTVNYKQENSKHWVQITEHSSKKLYANPNYKESLTLKNLKPSTSYIAYVVLRNINGKSIKSKYYTFKTSNVKYVSENSSSTREVSLMSLLISTILFYLGSGM